MISGAQVRAARGMLGWTRHELARRAVLSDATLYALETARGTPANVDALAAIQATLEAEGIEFTGLGARGVRLHPNGHR
jgi:transcriptional regulator with XRE-family HTH domain